MIEFKSQQLVLSGHVDFKNAAQLYNQGLEIIRKQANFPLVVDLSGLEQGNTLALAILVQWLRQTPQANGLHFKAVPSKMLKIIQACHLQDDLAFIQ
ncbi:STAS domain-containing protein [Acinetobacter sp. MD2(2019)]|uniref:STAS domain-containing protein n=1 Tax=Acinetobacter sp. MD2(2019) TaxID=2605273 RepID=UPI002D1E557B|nr:STAS domain-containing protein [Acinetobacter sp. MD2(2019)]MEB3754675.1 STAS domain-containing protein [Acinetobacter sp. MD2(2019)]